MNIGRKFFLSLKIFYCFIFVFVISIVVVCLKAAFDTNNWMGFISVIIPLIIIGVPIALGIYYYYYNIVVDLSINEETVHIYTNKKIYNYNLKDAKKIVQEYGKIYIYCNDKKYYYQTVYFIKEHLPDLDEWERKMIYTEFVRSSC